MSKKRKLDRYLYVESNPSEADLSFLSTTNNHKRVFFQTLIKCFDTPSQENPLLSKTYCWEKIP